MTLENTMIKNLSEWRAASRDTLLITDQDSPWTVQVTADRCETLGAQLWELTVSRSTAPANAKVADWARQIAAKTTGLPEPLAVLEVDELAQQALLRSQSPAGRDEKVMYFEVLVNGTTVATLRRYQASRDGHSRREQIPYTLTHEAVAAVVAGLTA